MTASRLFLSICSFLLVIPTFSYAMNTRTQTHFGQDIRLQSGEKMDEATCINCSIYVAGEISGDVTTIHGRIIVETGGSIGGDSTAVWGDVRLHPGSHVGGDVTSIAGAVRRDSESSVGGDITSLESASWLLAIILPPIFIVGLIVALIIWLVQRSRRSANLQPASAAQ